MKRIVFTLILLICLTAGVVGQVRVINPFRSDGLIAPGGSAVAVGALFADIEDSATSPHFLPLATEVAGVSAKIDGYPVGVWVVFREAVHMVVPEDLPIYPRQSPERELVLTTGVGEWVLTILIVKSAPAFITDGRGNLQGHWTMTGRDFHYVSEPIQIERASGGTWVAFWSSGVRAARRPFRRYTNPFELWFQPDMWIWIGNWKIPAQWSETGMPGFDFVGAYLPTNLPAGSTTVRIEADRVISEGLPIELVG